MPNFELYKRTSLRRGSATETVTVQARGLLSFSGAAWARLGSPASVVLLIDKNESLIGFRAGRRGEALVYPVRGTGHIISAISLLRHMGADYSTSRRYPLITEDGLPPYIDLKQPGTPVTSNRATKS